MNMVDDLQLMDFKEQSDITRLIYAGSFYYGRSDVISQLSKEIQKFNQISEKKAKLLLYSNQEPDDDLKKKMCLDGACEYCGSLNQNQLQIELNRADILVFVESFETDQIEKVRYSLSTKVPEYMSIGKPILALGPSKIGSIEYLKDVAICVNEPDKIENAVSMLLKNITLQKKFGIKAREKFIHNHNKLKLQQDFYNNVIGTK